MKYPSSLFFLLILGISKIGLATITCEQTLDKLTKGTQGDYFGLNDQSWIRKFLSSSESTIFEELIHFDYVNSEYQLIDKEFNFKFSISRSEYKGDGLPDITEVRNLLNEYPNHKFLTQPEFQTKQDVIDDLRIIRTFLYQDYLLQGLERSTNIDQYKLEDHHTSERTTHFVTILNGEVLSHIQAQHSFDYQELRNSEVHFPQARSFLRRSNDSVLIELGRYKMMKAEQVRNSVNSSLLRSTVGRDLIFAQTWLRLTGWLIKYTPQIPVDFQVNNSVFKIIQHQFAPLELKDRMMVQTKADLPKEWLVRLEPTQILELRKIVFVKKLKALIQIFIHHIDDYTYAESPTFTLTVEPDEVDLFDDFNIYSLSEKYRTRENYKINKKIFTDEIKSKRHLVRLGLNEVLELADLIHY